MSGPTSDLVKGHTLEWEGTGHDANGRRWEGDRDRGKCSCGELSPPLPSRNARKRWHREHKGAVIASGREQA